MHRKLLALVALSTLSWNVAKATHVAGGEIIYECLGNGQYQFSLILYRDCAGTTLGTSYTLDFTSPCGNQSLTVDVDTVFEVSQLCEDQLPFSSCNGGNLPGLEQHVFTGTITLPPCDFWTASWSLCCRNDAISNLQTPGTYDGYLETSMNNEDYPCDNSPVFTNAPIPYVCLNQPVVYSYGVYDPDGDSLSYALISAMTTGGVPIPYVFPYTFLEPIQAGLTFDPFTGLLQFTPNAIGNYVVVMEVTQYDDDGNVIGTTLRDMQFVVIACTNQAPRPNRRGDRQFQRNRRSDRAVQYRTLRIGQFLLRGDLHRSRRGRYPHVQQQYSAESPRLNHFGHRCQPAHHNGLLDGPSG
jgi:hypothetical protein